MAIHCIYCGTELPDVARFCLTCGKNPRGDSSGTVATGANTSSQATGDGWEFCDIDVVDAGDSVFGGSTYKWVASSIGKHGIYEVASSERLNGWPRGRRVGLGQELAPPTGRELEGYQQELQRFISRLTSGGWQPTQERGTYWYSYRFRRQTSTNPSSTYQPYSIQLFEQWVRTITEKGPTPALMMLDSYLAGAPIDSKGYMEALMQQLYIYGHLLYNDSETTRVARLIASALDRRLAKNPLDTEALSDQIQMWRLLGNKDRRKEAERRYKQAEQQLRSQGNR